MTKFEIQIRQAKVLIKSAVALNSATIRFILLGNDDTVLPAIEEYVSHWPDLFRNRLQLSYRPVIMPEKWHLMDFYEKCVTEKLFLHWVLSDFDSVVYLDTDHVFMRPPDHLVEHFKNFDDTQVLGVAPVDGYYLQHSARIPYYGRQGLSSALLLANLTRWRDLPFDWLPMVTSVAKVFKEGIIGDQDILNLVFSEFPDYIYDLSCDWSGSIEQCLTVNWNCSSIEQTGFSLVHGARSRFFAEDLWNNRTISQELPYVIPMEEIFVAWERHDLTDSLSVLLQNLTKNLRTREDELRRAQASHKENLFCPYSFEKLLKQLKDLVNLLS
ncbi:glucoside xylosyltransferase 2 isoform X1 [Hyalella azteca]|uniref:Glucoside xylosyltransferase 2 isoform X1 n=2 Tax=Hyalella azteca TaxID=294128 RepID=A0A8B7P7C2_HYAAZ|nr:glucoside xylosyltransferase 2 isoform X1 [Hyalella azteca]